MHATRSVAERFAEKWIPVTESGCWLWLDAPDKDGYGRLQMPGKKTRKAHQIAFELYHGPIPRRRWVLHTCDVRCCVNPAHLYAGTVQQNNADCIRRGRYVQGGKPHPGAANGRALITEAQAREIKHRYAAGETSGALGREFGLTYGAVWRLATGRAWGHL